MNSEIPMTLDVDLARLQEEVEQLSLEQFKEELLKLKAKEADKLKDSSDTGN